MSSGAMFGEEGNEGFGGRGVADREGGSGSAVPLG